MADQRCPNCGEELPPELGQHATNLVSDSVTCPHCGASVHLGGEGDQQPTDGAGGDVERAAAAPPGRTEGDTSFSGHEDLEGVADELERKSDPS